MKFDTRHEQAIKKYERKIEIKNHVKALNKKLNYYSKILKKTQSENNLIRKKIKFKIDIEKEKEIRKRIKKLAQEQRLKEIQRKKKAILEMKNSMNSSGFESRFANMSTMNQKKAQEARNLFKKKEKKFFFRRKKAIRMNQKKVKRIQKMNKSAQLSKQKYRKKLEKIVMNRIQEKSRKEEEMIREKQQEVMRCVKTEMELGDKLRKVYDENSTMRKKLSNIFKDKLHTLKAPKNFRLGRSYNFGRYRNNMEIFNETNTQIVISGIANHARRLFSGKKSLKKLNEGNFTKIFMKKDTKKKDKDSVNSTNMS